MSTPNEPIDWTATILTLAFAAAVAVALAAVLQRLTHRAGWHRAIWQTATLALAVLILAEATGLGNALAGWFSTRLAQLREPACPDSDSPRDAWHGEIPWNLWVLSGLDASSPAPCCEASDEDCSECCPDQAMLPVAIEAAEGESSVPIVLPPAQPPFRPTAWLAIVWLAGALVLVGRICLGRLLLRTFCRRRAGPGDAELQDLVRGVALRMRIHFPVRVLVGGPLAGPMAFGVFRPAIGLPSDFRDRFDIAQQQAMIAHELAHLAGRDPIWQLLADLVTAVLWWHPAAWWARARLRATSEVVADTACAVVPDGPDVLATCLVQLGARLVRPRARASLAIEGSGFRSSLGRRVHRLLTGPPEPWIPPHARRSTLARAACLVTLLVAALTCTAWSRPLGDTKGANMFSTIERSWQQSLAAFALAGILWTGDSLVADEPELNAVVAVSDEDDDDKGKKQGKKVIVVEKEQKKDKVEVLERELKELREAGKEAEAEKLEYKIRELRQKDEKPVKASAESGAIAELRERIRQLEAENAKLREALQSGRAKHAEYEFRVETGRKQAEGDAVKAKVKAEHHKAMEELHRSVEKMHAEGNKEQAEKLAAHAKEIAERMAESAKVHAEKLAREAELAAKEFAEKQPELAKQILEAQRAAAKIFEHAHAHSEGHDERHKAGEAKKAVQLRVGAAVKGDGDGDLAAVLKQLREDLGRLRDEVAELRQEVKGEKAPPKR